MSLFIDDSFRMPAGLAIVMEMAPSTLPNFIQAENAECHKSTLSTTTMRQAFSLFEKETYSKLPRAKGTTQIAHRSG
jgi:hypothetical protein